MSDTQIRERDQLPVTIALTQAGVAATPQTLRWRLDCVSTQQEVLNWAGLAADSTVYLTIPSSANVIRSNANLVETKRLTVQANYGTDQQVNQQFEYDVLNNDTYV